MISLQQPNSPDLLRLQTSSCAVTKAQQNRALLGEDTVTLTVESFGPVAFFLGSTLDTFGEVYTLNQLPTAKRADGKFTYDLTLEGPQYTLLRLLFLDTDPTMISLGADFSLTGELKTFAAVLLNNIHRVMPGWRLGEIVPNAVVPLAGATPLLPTKTLSFAAENCLAVMQRLCTEFGSEFDMVREAGSKNYTINFRKAGQLLPLKYAYGPGKGLYELSRSTVSGKDFITRLYAYGSGKNLPPHYRGFAPSLRLPGEAPYIEKADALIAFGIIEGSKTFDYIFPHRTGTITSVGPTGLTFIDVGMDFNLLEAGTVPPYPGAPVPKFAYLQGGVTAKIQVQSGNLAGYGFEVSFYDHLTHTFTINSFRNEQNIVFPGAGPFQLAPGDTYVLLDILMPASYLDAAELQLKNVAQAFLDANAAPRVQYTLAVSELYLTDRAVAGSVANVFNLGDIVQIKDEDLAIDKGSRVLSFSRDLLYPYRYLLTIADSYEVTLIQRILSEGAELKSIIKINDLRESKRALYGWQAGQELTNLIFETDGTFDGSRLKPLSVETGALAIGSRSQQLILNIVIEPNFNGNANVIRVGAGSLTHYTIADPIPTWQIVGETITLTDNAARYCYARCARTNLNDASIVFSLEQIKVDSSVTYYYFLLGILHTVDATGVYRWLDLTYGATTINGRFIRTGRIQSADGLTYFDLDSGEIGGRIIFSSGTNGTTDVAQLDAEFHYFANITYVNGRKNLSGRIVSYFQDFDPNTWAVSLRPDHDGDNWYKTSTKQLFSYDKTTNTWTVNTDKTAIAAFEQASRAQDTADGKRRTFAVQPFAPYEQGDLWTNGIDLFKCIVPRTAGQAYSAADWNRATNYDNTKVTIDNGVITAGSLKLAGDGGTVLAGITGNGISDDSVRFWAGTSFENRVNGSFRVLQSGFTFSKTGFVLEDASGVGLAGISGGGDPTRFWAGVPYADRFTAPYRVTADGAVTMTKGLLGKLTISDTGALVAINGNSSILLSVAETTSTGRENIKSIAAQSGFFNIAAHFEAFGGTFNFALYVPIGTSLLRTAILNGRVKKYLYSNANRSVAVFANEVDYVCMNPVSGRLDVAVGVNASDPGIEEGKELTFINLSINPEAHVMNTIQSNGDFRVESGAVLCIVYQFGAWYVKSYLVNGIGATRPLLPTTDL